MRKNAKGYREGWKSRVNLNTSLTLSEGGKEGKCWETPVKGSSARSSEVQRLAVEEVCGLQKQAYLSLPALFRHCWGSQWEARSWCTQVMGFRAQRHVVN